jgi:hypothetical protein
MDLPRKEDLIARDEKLEDKAEALREKLASHTDPSELIDSAAALNELLQARVFIKVMLVRLYGEVDLPCGRS